MTFIEANKTTFFGRWESDFNAIKKGNWKPLQNSLEITVIEYFLSEIEGLHYIIERNPFYVLSKDYLYFSGPSTLRNTSEVLLTIIGLKLSGKKYSSTFVGFIN